VRAQVCLFYFPGRGEGAHPSELRYVLGSPYRRALTAPAPPESLRPPTHLSPVWDVQRSAAGGGGAWRVALRSLDARDHRGRRVPSPSIRIDAVWALPGAQRQRRGAAPASGGGSSSNSNSSGGGGTAGGAFVSAAPGGAALLRPARAAAFAGLAPTPAHACATAPLLVRAVVEGPGGRASCRVYTLLCGHGGGVATLAPGAHTGALQACPLPFSIKERPSNEANLLS
jgi:hypothetical protein